MGQANRIGAEAPRLIIASAQTALPFPPEDADCGLIKSADEPSAWSCDEFDLEIWSAGTTNITAAVLWKMGRHPIVIADDTWTVSGATFTATSHAMLTGDGPVFNTNSGGALPDEVVAGTPYWIRYVSANTFQLHNSLEDAFSNTNPVTTTGAGTGTHTISDNVQAGSVNQTHRVHFHAMAQLGDDVSGTLTVELLAQKAWQDRYYHSRDAVGYAVSGTFSAAVAVTVEAVPVKKVQGA